MQTQIQTAEHQQLGAVRYSAMELGQWPDQQVARTVGVMVERVGEDAADPVFKQRAQEIAGNGSELDKTAAAYWHVKNGIRFVRDEQTAGGLEGVIDSSDVVEVIIRPVDMARYVDMGVGQGDCDDFSMYLAALLQANGIDCAFVTVAASGEAPDQYSHVYVVAYPRDEETGEKLRLACDASHGDCPGWEVPNIYGKLREWGVGSGGGSWIGEMLANVAGSFLAFWVWKKITQ